jgi:hypothetical protein
MVVKYYMLVRPIRLCGTQTGSPSNYWNIDYSLDGGTIWTSVTSNYLSTNGQFVWTVPTVQSTTVLMRVRDALNSSTQDQSNAFFTINIPILLTSPNGGEIWQGNTVQNITWTAIGTSNTYTIQYSVNGGSTWTNIVTNYSTVTGTYAWTIPAMATSTNCLIKVMDQVQNCMQDVSNAVFTINAAQPILITPNGGETLSPQCGYNITWNTATFYTNVVIEYSANNGTTWTMIVNGAGNSGSYIWSTPNTPTTQGLIRISNYGLPSLFDVSNATFTIAAPITVTAANGGETWYGCQTYNINWNASTCIQRFYVDYSTNNGTTWTNIAAPYNTSTYNTGNTNQTYPWLVPNGITTTQALIRIRDYYNSSTILDVSNAVFTINPNIDITVTSPNGGEVWTGLTTQTITWTNLPAASGQYNILYSTNGGASYTTITSNFVGNSYNWTVPNINNTTCRIKIVDAVNTCKEDASDANFTIAPATPILITPNGGETLSPQCGYNITWNTATFYTNVVIEYSANNGTTWTMIVNGAGNSGSYIWSTPNTPTTQGLIRISNYGLPSLFDVSNATFTIAAPITVTAANGGETWYGCQTYNINWNASTCIQRFYVDYSTNNGTTWTNIAAPYNTSTYNTGNTNQTYPWLVPNGITTTQALIRIRDYYNSSTILDVSNAVFTINPNIDITVTSPNGGEVWTGLTTQTITWTNLPAASGQYNILYSTNGGASYTTITSNFVGNSYNWTVPNINNTTCRIKIVDAVNTCKEDASDANFTIAPATPILITPNGGETLSPQCGYNITWNTATFYTNVVIEYSANNGTTWTMIVNGAGNSGSYIWSTPNTPTTQGLIRISNYGLPSLFDVSNATFTIAAPITVTAANGGETWYGCQTYNINWNASTCIQRFYVDYSTNNGTTWTNIAAPYNTSTYNTGNTNQTYPWLVPNGITTTQALIRIRDYYNSSTILDVSNAVFTINPNIDITVTTPNGGEVWTGLTTQTITWTNLPAASGQYNILYSTNGGASYTTITSNFVGNSYNWTVPNINNTTCRIKIVDAVNTCKEDASDANFTIAPATPILITPNGGETLSPQCGYNITWNTATFYTNVVIEYSANNGTTWTMIVNGAGNSGSYIWSTPNTPTTQGLIRISNYGLPSLFDVSNATFTIAAPITVTAANGGETWYGCQTYNINWNASTCIQRFYVDYSTNNGTTWTNIAAPYNTSTYNTGNTNQTYPWLVPNGITTTQALIRIRDYYNSSTILDVSNAVFTINPNIDITVTTPNGGEVWTGLTTQTITWTNLPAASGQYNILYSTNGGASYTTITSNFVGNSYNWTVPNINNTTCRIKIVDAVNTCKEDASDANFTIAPATPILITPNGGETLSPQCGYNITWNTATFYTNVVIEYSANNGTTWTMIVNGAGNSGSYIWSTPNTPTTQGLIRISNYGLPSLFDVSNATFTIAAPITVTAANGGETWYGCQTYNINWNASTCIQRFYVDYSTNNGTTWTNIAAPYNTSTYNTGNTNQTYPWLVPNGITTTQALIRIRDYYNSSTILDVSNAVFTINPNIDITVTSPNGGEVWTGLTTQTITWTNLPAASGQYNILYSTNGGASYTTITSNFVGNSYNWTVPNINNTTCRIKIVDAVNTCKEDASDANFTIAPATPILITPNGGESMYSGTNYVITWNTATLYTNVVLEYSINNGSTWTMIVNGAGNSGSYNWTVPNANSNQCLVRISNFGYPAVSDVSNAVFTIKPAVTVLTPNGNNGVTVWGGCTVTSITFDRSPAWTNYKIEYSLNNGGTWTTIIASWATTANPATYNWNIPNSPTSSALVRVTPVSTSYADQSDAVFTITKPVTIIQPNFGGIMQVGSTYTISWSSDGISNIYDIFYSTNGGASFTNIVTGYNTSTNTYPWTVPNAPSTNCKIWVRDNINSCKADTSDIAFTISTTAPAITLTSPNGINDTLNGCHTKTITWTDSPTIGTYDIAYSLNSGSTWVNIVTAYATATHSYDWVVPNNINSNQVLLRVRSTSTPSTFDLSDAFFTIRNGNLVATPTSVSVCSAVPVQLNATGGFNYNWTPSTGLSATNSSNPVATPPSTTTYYVQSINGSCILSDTVTINITTGATTASVAISAAPSTTICVGTSVTFTATPTNGGTTPSYQWKVNGSNVGTNSTTFTSSSLNNNDVVTCVMSSNLPCVSGSPATSNTVTMTVSPNVTPSVTVSASPSATICSGTNVTFTATPTNGGTTPAYQWLLNGTPIGTNSSTFSNAGLANGNTIAVVLTSDATCLTTSTATSSTTTMSVNTIPNQPGIISGTTTICAGTTNTYSIASVGGAASYTWTLPGGWTGTSTSTSISATASTTSGTISVTANNGCGNSAAQTIAITVNQIPAQPASISGTTTICSGTSNTYSISPVAGATSYTWSAPSGWTGTSTTETITTTASNTSGNITVTANNTCGNSTSQQVAITVNTIPATPGTISGSSSVCQTSTNTYSVATVPGATSYTWTLPAGWSGTSTSTSISATAGTTGGTITVTANNTCGNSGAQSLVVTTNAIPAQPSSINGNATVCQNATEGYSILAVAGATSYTWTLPGGWSGTSTTTNISAIAGIAGGTISVTANNTCGNSSPQVLTISMNTIPAQPGTISGNSTVCEGTNQTYSIAPVANTTSYVWTYPSGWSASGTTETSNATSGANSGTITVAAQNTCGTSATQSFAVTVNQLPAAPASISGNFTVCETASETYSISPVSGASSYVWTFPSGWSGTSTTENISLTVGSPDGDITVAAINGCGTGTATILAVVSTTTPAQPAPISGITEICGNGSLISFATTNDVNVDDYTWTLPTGWTGSSFAFNITATNSDSSGVISVVGTNTCGTSIPQTLNFTVNPLPIVTFASLPIVCSNAASFVLTGGSPAGGVYSGPGVSNDSIFDPASAGNGTHTIFYTYNDGTCSNDASSTIQVDMCTGIQMLNTSNNSSVTVYPNPFNDYTTIRIDSKLPLIETSIRVYDVIGKEVISIMNINKNTIDIQRGDLKDGMYFYKVVNNGIEIGAGKLIID